MNKLLTEFIGTFFLVLVIATAPPAPGMNIAIGAILMVMVYMGGHISGAHYNPAVTLAVFIRGKITLPEMLRYWIAQFAAAFVAAAIARLITGHNFAAAPGSNDGIALLCEVLFTFALALVVLHVATNPKTAGNSYYGAAIGFTVAAAAFTVGGISGGAFNPAVGISPAIHDALYGGKNITHAWIYALGPFAGAALAALVYKLQTAGDPA